MNRLRKLFAAVLAAGMFAYAAPSVAQMPSDALKAAATASGDVAADGADDAEANPPSETDDAAEDVPATAEDASDASDASAAADADADAAIDDIELEDEPSPWTNGLVMSIAAMCIEHHRIFYISIWAFGNLTRLTVAHGMLAMKNYHTRYLYPNDILQDRLYSLHSYVPDNPNEHC